MADKFSNVSTVMTLTAEATAVDATITVNDATGLPLTFPYRLAIAYETANVEIVVVTAAASNTLTVTRGQEDTPARTHSTGTIVVHVWTAKHATDTTSHIEQTQNVHGVGPGNAVVGTGSTQTLTNKTINAANNTISGITDASISSLSGSKITGAITVATIAVANVTGDWPIDTRSTGNLPIDTRTTGNLPIDTRTTGSLPIDTRTTGNLPGSRVASPIGPTAWTANGTIVTQGNSSVPAVDVLPNASATAPSFRSVGTPTQAAGVFKRNNGTTSGNLAEFQTESGTVLSNVNRLGQGVFPAVLDKNNNVDLTKPPTLRASYSGFQGITNASFTNLGGYTVHESNGISMDGSGQITVTNAGVYQVSFGVSWQSNSNGIRMILLNGSFGIPSPSSRIAPAGGADETSHMISLAVRLTAGQLFFTQVYQTSGGAPLGLTLANCSVVYLGR